MKINLFENWDKKLLTVLYRFPVPVTIALVYAVLAGWDVHSAAFRLGDNFTAFFITGFFLSVATALAVEQWTKRCLAQAVTVVLTGLWLLFWLFQPSKFEDEWLFYLSAMVLAAFVLAIFFGAYGKKDATLPFWNFTVNMVVKAVISVLFAGVLMGGLSLAFLAVNILFKANLNNHVYAYLAIFCFIVFMPVYFLSNVPDKVSKHDVVIRFNIFLKIFSLYIVLPILLIYTAILYAYLFKIIVQWQLPNGWVSWLVSVLGVGGFLAIMLLHPLYVERKSRFGSLFCRYFPLAILPLLVLMTVGIFRRFNDYGLTINRLLIILLNAWMYGVAVYLLATRSKGIRMVFVSFAVIAFLAAVGPWSVFAITRKSITSHIELTFAKYHMLKNGKVDLTSGNVVKPDSATYEKLESALYYVGRNFGDKSVQSFFADSLKQNYYALVGKLREKYGSESVCETSVDMKVTDRPFTTEGFRNIVYFDFPSQDSISDDEKTICLRKKGNDLIFKQKEQDVIVIPLTGIAEKFHLFEKSRNPVTTDMTTFRNKNCKLVLRSMYGNLGKDTVISRVEGVLLY